VDGSQSVGDAGWLDEDGYLYLAGRCDDVIVTGGLNVHPERVEAELFRLESVQDAVVFGAESREWGQCVTALVVLNSAHAGMSPRDLIAACSARLAPEEVPRIVEFRETLPRDGFGKIQRKALQAEFRTLQTTA
jgi:bile acid-coenzyme A ligase